MTAETSSGSAPDRSTRSCSRIARSDSAIAQRSVALASANAVSCSAHMTAQKTRCVYAGFNRATSLRGANAGPRCCCRAKDRPERTGEPLDHDRGLRQVGRRCVEPTVLLQHRTDCRGVPSVGFHDPAPSRPKQRQRGELCFDVPLDRLQLVTLERNQHCGTPDARTTHALLRAKKPSKGLPSEGL